MLTEAEFVELFTISPRDVKNLKKLNCCNEEGEQKEFYVISLKGLDASQVFGMRRIQLAHEVTIEKDEFQMLHSEQLVPSQPSDWFSFASQKHFENFRPFKLTGKANLLSPEAVFKLRYSTQLLK